MDEHMKTPTNKPPQIDPSENETLKKLLEEKSKLENMLAEKDETLKQLQMVKRKNDLKEMDSLIKKWRDVSQNSLEELQKSLPAEPRPSMTELLNFLHVEKSLIQYDGDEECFY